MERLLRITNKLLRPRLVLLVPLAVISAAALAAVFTLGLEDTAMAYASYGPLRVQPNGCDAAPHNGRAALA